MLLLLLVLLGLLLIVDGLLQLGLLIGIKRLLRHLLKSGKGHECRLLLLLILLYLERMLLHLKLMDQWSNIIYEPINRMSYLLGNKLLRHGM